MRMQLQKLLQARVEQCVSQTRSEDECEKIARKKACFAKRDVEIVKAHAEGRIIGVEDKSEAKNVVYSVHFQYLLRQKGLLYMEEEIEQRRAAFHDERLLEDVELATAGAYERQEPKSFADSSGLLVPSVGDVPIRPSKDAACGAEGEVVNKRAGFKYDRLKAVQYAEKWWNTYNPNYRKFENDCTNFISQCLHEGGVPMRGYPNRGAGWWMNGQNYSYSWAVAHALKNLLQNSKQGLKAKEVKSAEELLFGDVICYDFQGDGRFDHNTMVTGKDANGMPLVNAHTYNSRQRYWAYEDSTAYTPNIKYKFFTIDDA